MGAPEHVPLSTEPVRTYRSAPRRAGSWMADRPGEIDGRQPHGAQLGSPGPDQGYLLGLAQRFEGQVRLQPGERQADALAGAIAVALKRASLFGRAPVVHDLRVALHLWRFFDDAPPAELIPIRRAMFEECHHPHHYPKLRAIADAVPAEVLHGTADALMVIAAPRWREALVVPEEFVA